MFVALKTVAWHRKLLHCLTTTDRRAPNQANEYMTAECDLLALVRDAARFPELVFNQTRLSATTDDVCVVVWSVYWLLYEVCN